MAVVILGSSRSHGDTRKLTDFLVESKGYVFVDLNDYKISYYDYHNSNVDDDYLSLMQDISKHDHLIFASPIYWYSMSAQMKTFFDRFTDIMTVRKDIGKSLAGKKVSVISCSGSSSFNEEFPKPFERTAGYFDMEYHRHVHGWIKDSEVPSEVKQKLLQL
ncbi:MAG: NAD(P)H-dependent oxidoreductase [Bacteroidota bacterium]